ncbi:MAG: M24 family metallopeptidase [Patescibacteria group bacterium]|nr:M24 family metallopeptidase [Patescibacteria group bacterium]
MNCIGTIVKSREAAGIIIAKALENHEGISEAEVCDRILANLSAHKEFYPMGWYDPPPGGVAVLFGEKKPYTRLQFETLRSPQFFPTENNRFNGDTVGILYASPIDRATGMIGDVGCTVYGGGDRQVRQHLTDIYNVVYKAAEHAQVGMSFSTLYETAIKLFADHGKKIRWMTTTHDSLKINLGHTIPGSYGNNYFPGDSFEEVRESIRLQRLYINATEGFVIPETCAFTVEARLVDIEDSDLPNVQVHFIVTFSQGEKKILGNFDAIFKVMKMDYLMGKY